MFGSGALPSRLNAVQDREEATRTEATEREEASRAKLEQVDFEG